MFPHQLRNIGILKHVYREDVNPDYHKVVEHCPDAIRPVEEKFKEDSSKQKIGNFNSKLLVENLKMAIQNIKSFSDCIGIFTL